MNSATKENSRANDWRRTYETRRVEGFVHDRRIESTCETRMDTRGPRKSSHTQREESSGTIQRGLVRSSRGPFR